MDLGQRVLNGDRRAAARLITLVENGDKDAISEVKELYKYTGNAHVIGITGPPGAGKSTVTFRAASYFLNKNRKIGIIAVDPTSPFTGGAILGDRVRMQELSVNPNVFIRSMGTRGHLGGLSRAASSAVKILDSMGCDYIFVETVGVGQSEVDIVRMADTTVIVMVPGLGDDIQAIKAGIMEIGDIFLVNKSDRDGADRVVAEINAVLDFNNYDRKPPVIKAVATLGSGIEELGESITEHMEYLKNTNKLLDRRKHNSKVEILETVKQNIMYMIESKVGDVSMDEIAALVSCRELDPFTAAERILHKISE